MKREFVKLGEICSIQSGGTPNRSCQEYWANGDVPWVKIGDLSEKFVTKTEECITHSGLTHSSAKLFPPGTILYSIFATLGAVSILKIEATTNQAIAGIQITSEKVDRGYLFYYLSRYDNKLRLMKKSPRKVYIVDNGFVAAKAFALSDNLGHLLENQVFVELLRRGYDTDKTLFYYRSRNNKEVDFVLRKGVSIERLVQVCYDMGNLKTEKREVDSLIECAGELKCRDLVIVTHGEERVVEKEGYRIQIVPFSGF